MKEKACRARVEKDPFHQMSVARAKRLAKEHRGPDISVERIK